MAVFESRSLKKGLNSGKVWSKTFVILQDKKNADESACLVNELVTLRNKSGKILLNGVCIQPSLTTELLIRSQQNRFWFALKL